MRIHLIAVGGAVMHNLALALLQSGYSVSGSDDEIYDPARTRLAAAGLLPEPGWHPDRITTAIDAVIVGMHARTDNPELARALELGLPVYSYPDFIYEHARGKTRCVVAGSHGKTTTTAMAMHALRLAGREFDYLVGAQLEGFDTMVRLSDAPVLVVEGDEYFASPLDPVAKMVRYRPHHAAITGIAWDHVNVFPTFDAYRAQFAALLDAVEPGGSVSWYRHDAELQRLIETAAPAAAWHSEPFEPFDATVDDGCTLLQRPARPPVPLAVFGAHNLLNARAAALLCAHVGVAEDAFVEALRSFRGAARRLQLLAQRPDSTVWLDFAHAPSKVRATTEAVRALHPGRRLVAVLELHTFSSLNRDFLPQYQGTLDAADAACVFYSPHTLAMKRLPEIVPADVQRAFAHRDLQVVTTGEAVREFLGHTPAADTNVLLMSSGTFGGINLEEAISQLHSGR